MNYENELRKLNESTEYFKPSDGQYKVTFQEELGEPRTTHSNTLNKDMNQSEVKITCEGLPFTWTIGVGGKISLYGQLVKLAVHWGGLKNKTVTLLVQRGKDNKRQFTILESIAIKPGIQVEKAVIN